jgi:hypothetical protein
MQQRLWMRAQVGEPVPGAGRSSEHDLLVDGHVPDLDAASLTAAAPYRGQLAGARNGNPPASIPEG